MRKKITEASEDIFVKISFNFQTSSKLSECFIDSCRKLPKIIEMSTPFPKTLKNFQNHFYNFSSNSYCFPKIFKDFPAI